MMEMNNKEMMFKFYSNSFQDPGASPSTPSMTAYCGATWANIRSSSSTSTERTEECQYCSSKRRRCVEEKWVNRHRYIDS